MDLRYYSAALASPSAYLPIHICRSAIVSGFTEPCMKSSPGRAVYLPPPRPLCGHYFNSNSVFKCTYQKSLCCVLTFCNDKQSRASCSMVENCAALWQTSLAVAGCLGILAIAKQLQPKLNCCHATKLPGKCIIADLLACPAGVS